MAALRITSIERAVRFGDTPRLSFAEAVAHLLQQKADAGMPSAESDANHLSRSFRSSGISITRAVNDTSPLNLKRTTAVMVGSLGDFSKTPS